MATKLEKILAGLSTHPRATLRALTQKEFESLIKRLDKAYFVTQEPMVSDTLYDIVRTEYKKLFPQGSLVSKIGDRTFADTQLVVPMPSLDQYAAGSSKLQKALDRPAPKVLTDKLDGQSVEIVYQNGKPSQMLTRGDSTHGTDRSYHLPNVKVPKRIPYKGRFVVRLEAIIQQAHFQEKMHKDVGGSYVAARNAAGGLINTDKPTKAMRSVNFVAFEILEGEGAGGKQSAQLKRLTSLGFTVPWHLLVTKLTEKKLIAILDKRVAESEYEIDGLVVADNVAYEHGGSQNPKHAFKFKMNTDASTALVVCSGVEFQMSKNGSLTPVVLFPPTRLAGGAMCQRATGHNGFYIEHGYLKDDKNADRSVKRPIGKGAVLKIVRSGSVIPYIMEIIKPAKKAALPDVPFKRKGVDFVADIDDLDNHPEVLVRRIDDFLVSTGVKGVGAATIEKLVGAGLVTSLQSLMTVEAKKTASVIGLAQARLLDRELDTALFDKGARLDQLFKGLAPFVGLEGMGERNWGKVLPMLPSDVNALQKLTRKQVLDAIGELSELSSKQEQLSVAIPAIARMIRQMRLTVRTVNVKGKSKVTGQVVLFTGFRDNVLKEKLLEAGATVAGSLTKSVTLVVASDVNGSGSKLDKARETGVKIIDKRTLESML